MRQIPWGPPRRVCLLVRLLLRIFCIRVHNKTRAIGRTRVIGQSRVPSCWKARSVIRLFSWVVFRAGQDDGGEISVLPTWPPIGRRHGGGDGTDGRNDCACGIQT